MWFKCIFQIILLIFAIIVNNGNKASKLTLYRTGSTEKIVINGNECPYGALLSRDEDVSCACLTGLWALYEDTCSGPKLISGSDEEKCVQVNQKVRKVHLLSSPGGSTAAVFTNSMKITSSRLEMGGSAKDVSINSTGEFTVLATGSNSWGLKSLNTCLGDKSKAKKAEYCSYTYTATSDTKLQTNCEVSTSVPPTKCTPFIQTSFQCPAPVEEEVHIEEVKRQGRVFLSAVTQMNNRTTNNTISDLDENKNITINITSPEMNSELWNYLNTRGEEILNLTQVVKKAAPSPTFKFLEIAKQILQKACPDHYVTDGHFDMSLQTFSNLQTKHYNFQDTFSDYAAGQRIEDSLKVCLDNITTYPFVDPKKVSGASCNTTIEMGTYDAFGTKMEFNLTTKEASRNNEPIIETVWRIFTHAHSACYKYFEDNYNDHHRFTSVIMPLFANQINSAWANVTEVTKDTYAGLLGDALSLMDGVAYCSQFGTLNTEYPWELPRPTEEKIETSKRRKKRSLTSDIVCLKEAFDNKCSNV